MEYLRHRLDARVSSVLGRLSTSPHPDAAQSLMDRLTRFVPTAGPTPSGRDLETALAPVRWLVDRAAGGGVPLTQAGYIRPADVTALAGMLPRMEDWIFPVKREGDVQPVHGFRRFVQRAGLLRTSKGALVLTPAARKVRGNPQALWAHLAEHLVPSKPAFDEDCSVVCLIHLGSERRDRVSTATIATTLGHLGWAHQGGRPITRDDVQWVVNDLWDALGNVGPLAGSRRAREIGPVAQALIRDALVEYTVTE